MLRSQLLLLLWLLRPAQSFSLFRRPSSNTDTSIYTPAYPPENDDSNDVFELDDDDDAEDPVKDPEGLVVASLFNSSNTLLASLNTPASLVCVSALADALLPACWRAASPHLVLLDAERRLYALALSVCQWHVSFVIVPLPCRAFDPAASATLLGAASDAAVAACLTALQQSPNLWTTYNGYYQAVGATLCTHVAPEIRLRKTVRAYTRISAAQAHLATDLARLVAQLRVDARAARALMEQTARGAGELVHGVLADALQQQLAQHAEALARVQHDNARAVARAQDSAMAELAQGLGAHAQQMHADIELARSAALDAFAALLTGPLADLNVLVAGTQAAANSLAVVVAGQRAVAQEHDRLADRIAVSIDTVEHALTPQIEGLGASVAALVRQVESISVERALAASLRGLLTRSVGPFLAVVAAAAAVIVLVAAVHTRIAALAGWGVAVVLAMSIARMVHPRPAETFVPEVFTFNNTVPPLHIHQHINASSKLLSMAAGLFTLLAVSSAAYWLHHRKEAQLHEMLNLPWTPFDDSDSE